MNKDLEINIDFEKFGTNNDSNRFEEMDFTVGNTDTESNHTVTVTIDNKNETADVNKENNQKTLL